MNDIYCSIFIINDLQSPIDSNMVILSESNISTIFNVQANRKIVIPDLEWGRELPIRSGRIIGLLNKINRLCYLLHIG